MQPCSLSRSLCWLDATAIRTCGSINIWRAESGIAPKANTEKPRSNISNALKVDKSYTEAHYALAQTYVHLGQFSLRRTRNSRVPWTCSLTNYKARIDLGNLLLAGGKIDDAQKQADAVMAAQPNNPDLHALLSAIAVRRGHKDHGSDRDSAARSELDPNRAAFHEDLALLQSADPAKASAVEDELKKAVALDPKSVNAKLLSRGILCQEQPLAEAEKIRLGCRRHRSQEPSCQGNSRRDYSEGGRSGKSRRSAASGVERSCRQSAGSANAGRLLR